jgi:hypothetical protein
MPKLSSRSFYGCSGHFEMLTKPLHVSEVIGYLALLDTLIAIHQAVFIAITAVSQIVSLSCRGFVIFQNGRHNRERTIVALHKRLHIAKSCCTLQKVLLRSNNFINRKNQKSSETLAKPVQF